MQLYAIKTQIIKPGDDLVEIVLNGIKGHGIRLDDGDVLALASKAVATANKRVANLKTVTVSNKAKVLAEKFDLTPEFTQLIINTADKVYGGVEKALLTLQKQALNVNSGIDNKNAPQGHVVLPVEEPHRQAEKIRKEIEKRTGRKIGVIIVDSGVYPLRMGTRGLAVGVSGFEPVKDYRGNTDLFQKKILITRHALADDLASAAHFLMGEADEKAPAVLIKNIKVKLTENDCSGDLYIPFNECVFMKAFKLEEA